MIKWLLVWQPQRREKSTPIGRHKAACRRLSLCPHDAAPWRSLAEHPTADSASGPAGHDVAALMKFCFPGDIQAALVFFPRSHDSVTQNVKVNNKPSLRVVRLGRVSPACRRQAHVGTTSHKACEEARRRDSSEHDQTTRLRRLVVKFV